MRFIDLNKYFLRRKNMKKTMWIITTALTVLLYASCNDGLSNSSGTGQSGSTDRKDRSQRTTIDPAKYIDFTVPGTNAKMFKKQDLLADLWGTFRSENGNSFIKIDRQEGAIVISSDSAVYQGKSNVNMYAKYVFDVAAASSDCLYIRMADKRSAHLIIGSDSFQDGAVPDLLVCLPLYGYSRNRIEVSPVMNGFIAMPSGTYWADKK
jgi:hypothetical protein